MTAVLFLLTGITVTVVPSVIAVNLRAEQHHWRLARLEYLRVNRLWEDKDHFERLAKRRQRRVRHLTARLAQVTRSQPRRSPVPVYGPHRQEVRA